MKDPNHAPPATGQDIIAENGPITAATGEQTISNGDADLGATDLGDKTADGKSVS